MLYASSYESYNPSVRYNKQTKLLGTDCQTLRAQIYHREGYVFEQGGNGNEGLYYWCWI